MSGTRHMCKRMNQRGFDNKLMSIIEEFVKPVSCREGAYKYCLNKKTIQQVLDRFNQIKKQLVNAHDKGGAVVVATPDGLQITTYRPDSYRRPKRKR